MNNSISLPDQKPLPNMDVVGLLHWYHNEIIKHKKAFKGTLNALYLYFIIIALPFISFVLSLFNPKVQSLTMLVGLLPSAVLIIYFFLGKKRKVADIISGNRYVRLNEKQFPKIWAASYEIMRKMKLSYTLKIYYVKKEKAVASVVLEDNTIYLLLSRGMITYSHMKFKDVESIIGHEMGHVCQGDSKLLLIGKSTIQIPIITVVLSWMILRLGIFSEFDPIYKTLIDLGIIWLLPFACWFFIVQRRHSEYLADMASVIFVENSTITDLIKQNVPRLGNLSYPSGRKRMEYIQKTINQYNKVNQPFPLM